MTDLAPGVNSTAPADRTGRLGWAIAGAVFVAFAITALVNMQTGLHGDPRTTNPSPGTGPYPPFLSVLDRHRFFAVFLTGFVAGLPLNALMQFMWLKVGLFVYTEAAGPVLHLFGRQLPLYMVIYDSVLFAIVALLCVRDDSGRPAIVAKLAQRLPALGTQITTTRLTVIATAVLMSAVLLPIAVFSLLRVTDDPKPAYDDWPFPTIRVYDPYGDLERAGRPGPFYR